MGVESRTPRETETSGVISHAEVGADRPEPRICRATERTSAGSGGEGVTESRGAPSREERVSPGPTPRKNQRKGRHKKGSERVRGNGVPDVDPQVTPPESERAQEVGCVDRDPSVPLVLVSPVVRLPSRARFP